MCIRDRGIYEQICKKALALEREMEMQGRILYSSFNHYALLTMRQQDPLAKIGLLYECVMVLSLIHISKQESWLKFFLRYIFPHSFPSFLHKAGAPLCFS